MKKLLTFVVAAVLAVASCLGLAACTPKASKVKPYNGIKQVSYSDMKVGLICLHGDSSTYDKNFIDAFNAACAAKGVTGVVKTDVDENNEAYEAAVELVEDGCNLIFADSFGHEDFILKAAKEYPEVQFCHATGYKAASTARGNFHNAFANIFEGRFLAGYAAGLKLLDMTDKAVNNNFNLGYVGAWPFAEVKSGYTSWFLGVKAALEDDTETNYTATMDVIFTNNWYDPVAEKEAANTLISTYNAVLVSQHADSMGAPEACETANVPNVSYNGSTATACPNTFIISSRINWQPYYEYCMKCLNDKVEIAYDYSEGFGTTWTDGSVCLTELGTAAAAGSEAKINTVLAQLNAKTRFVFDCSKFTVNGAALTAAGDSLVKTDATTNITYYAESSVISAPSFAYDIDGITIREQY